MNDNKLIIGKFLNCVFILFVVVVLVTIWLNKEDEQIATINESMAIEMTEETLLQEITDEKTREELILIYEKIDIDKNEVKDFKRIEDWMGNQRYSFVYRNILFTVNCNSDATIKTIRFDADKELYKQGYEPYKMSDYTVDVEMENNLKQRSELLIKQLLNYPSTADFSLFDWEYGNENNIYTVIGSVKSQNAFGVESEMDFGIRYYILESYVEVLYMELGNEVAINKLNEFVAPERKQLELNLSTDNVMIPSEITEIILIHGELGEYGKKVIVGDSEFINYYVPSGSYEILSHVEWCNVYLANEGNEYIATLEFTKSEQVQTIVVNDGEHIELTIGANISIALIDVN